jgi:hypothetical protein
VTLTLTHIKIVHTAVSGSGWTCPLTMLAERLSAASGSVAGIFLPKWFADRFFPICGTTYLVACVLLLARLLR